MVDLTLGADPVPSAFPSRISVDQIDLSGLPAPSAIDTFANNVLFTIWLQQFQVIDPAYTILLESDPAIELLEVGGYREEVLRVRINDALKALLLPLSYGSNLDALGARFGVVRLLVTPANTLVSPAVPAVYESDDAFRERIALAPDAWAGAGAYGAYIYYARTSDGNIVNAEAYNAASGLVNPGSILVVILTSDDSLTTAALTNCYNLLHSDDVAMMTDNVIIQAASKISYDVTATIYVGNGPDPALIQAQAVTNVQNVCLAHRRIGRRVPMSAIIAALQFDGVNYAVVANPTSDVLPSLTQYAEVGTIAISVQMGV